MTWCTLQSLEDQREQLKELLKDKEDEIQMLATEKSDEQNNGDLFILNNQVERKFYFCKLGICGW